jgi:cellulose synthase/poly-beta-1,6-N-acetylglucosamine synthase-like glycosyltransferase
VIGALGLAGVAGFGHVVYPLWLWATTRGRRDRQAPDSDEWPGITFVVPAYRERKIIGRKLDDLEAQEYPGARQIVVVADDPETAQAARRPGVELIEGRRRQGKTAALNRGVAAARHPIVVVTDANAMLARGSSRSLARWFADDAVGAVAGEKRVSTDAGEGAYWAFEAWLKRLETRRGSTISLVGELAAVRRDAYVPLPADLAVDDLWMALDVIETGLSIVYEPRAVALEDPNDDWRDDWERRTRIVSGALDVLVRRRHMLVPGRSRIAVELWGHKLMRQSAGPLAHLGLVLLSIRAFRRCRLARLSVLAHAAAGQALARRLAGQDLSAPERLAAQVLFLQAVALGGMVRYLRRDRPALWPKLER